MVDHNILDERRSHINHRIITTRERGLRRKWKVFIPTESSLMSQTIQRLQSIHCQRIVRIFSTSLSEYCKQDGCPRGDRVGFVMRMGERVFTGISTFGTINHFFGNASDIFLIITQTKSANTDWFSGFLQMEDNKLNEKMKMKKPVCHG